MRRPLQEFRDTKANIEALATAHEGAIAWATDTDEFGCYDGAAWHWSGLDIINELNVGTTTELTIDAAGAVTRTQTYHRIDTFGGAATDNLDTIAGGATGDLLFIRPEDGARTIVVRHGIDNIWIPFGAAVTLDDINDHAMFIYDGTVWCAIGL